MAEQKKGLAALILEKPKESEDEAEKVDSKDVAIDELFEALDAKDKAGVKSALSSFVSMCQNKNEDEEE